MKRLQSGGFTGTMQKISTHGSPYPRWAIWLYAQSAAFSCLIVCEYCKALKVMLQRRSAIGPAAVKLCSIIVDSDRDKSSHQSAMIMNYKISFRMAVEEDLPELIDLYKDAIRHMQNAGIDQWDDIYPSPDILQNDIRQEYLYLCMLDGKIAAAFALSQERDPEYGAGNWHYSQKSFSVVHRLCVAPIYQGRGIATKTMLAAEDILKAKGVSCIRLDAFSLNPSAVQLYEKLGYTKVGTVQFRKGSFFLYEKII